MKNLTKFFLAIAVLFAGFACTTDATEDLGIEVNQSKGTTEITLSLEESRTQLGEKADNTFPLYWSNGDKISVNGVESNTITVGEKVATASFTIPAALEAPYCIAYPAAPVGEVLFAAEQTHADNTTFASGVSTMYGYSEEGLAAEMHHLTGVLKIGVTGSATLTHAQISNANRAPIAGPFAIDFTTGVVTPTKTSKGVISYSFGEGVTLSNTPTYLHVAVPAGTYGELYVTLYDNAGGVMYATITADSSKPLTAGNVREFTNNIVYKAKTGVYIIKDVASLKAFATAAPTLTTDAVIVNDIDMTGETWTTIAAPNYAKTVYGNGFAIKGLTAPFFGQTKASFVGVHLVDVDIKTEGERMVGGLVNYMTNAAAVVKNCSVSGNIVVSTKTALTSYYSIGGIIGTANNPTTEFSNLHNAANITFTGNTKSNMRMGGVAGYSKAALVNCSNTGAITYEGVSGSGPVVIGGVVGQHDGAKAANCVNGSADDDTLGLITVTGTSATNMVIGGVVANASTNCTDVSGSINYGDIHYSGTSGTVKDGTTKIGGVCGGFFADATNLLNASSSEIIVGGTSVDEVYIGGVMSHTTKTLSNSTNLGTVTWEGSYAKNLWIAGVVARCTGASNCVNGSESDATLGTVNANGTNSAGNGPRIAGCVGLGWGTIKNCHNYAAINTGYKGISGVYIGGVIGTNNNDTAVNTIATECTNNGKITTSGEFGLAAHIGGIISSCFNQVTLTNCHNRGDIECTSASTFLNDDVRMGGIICYINKTNATSLTDCSNSGNITFNGNAGKTVCIGGCVGLFYPTDSNADSTLRNGMKNILNSGTLTVAGTITGKNGNVRLGGVVGVYNTVVLNTKFVGGYHKNTGKLIYSADFKDVAGTITIGGYAATKNMGMLAANFTPINEGDIECKVPAVEGQVSYIGGIIGNNSKSIGNSKSFCTISADGYPNVGMATGTPRTEENYATNCCIGGRFAIKDVEDNRISYEDITLENYTNFLYGGQPDWTGTDNYDGCKYISAIDATPLPEDAPAETPEE